MVRSLHKLFKLTNSRISALPKPYIDYLEQSRVPAERVHDDPPRTKYLDYDQDPESGYVFRVPDHPIHVVRTPRSELGLWGGLGMVEGFEKPKRMKPRIARVWWPKIERHTFYSEILDTHINIEVTVRTLELIDKHQGFDFYILATPVQDLVSELGRRLKRKILIALAKDSREYIRQKYKDHIRPIDEVAWYGLKEHEAYTKFKLMSIEEQIEPPLKLKYAEELVAQLKQNITAKDVSV